MDREPAKLAVLAQACRVADKIAELDAAAAEEPLTVRGSAGQTVIHPLISEVRFQRALMAQLLGRLGLPDTDEAIAERAEYVSSVRRSAARSAHLKVVPK